MKFLNFLISTILFFSFLVPIYASRETDSYDGNIFPIYAGNGSIVPPQTTLKESLKNNRVALLFFYLDDSSDSKALAPIISGLDLLWKNSIDIIALTTDDIQGKVNTDPQEENYYWNGLIPQTVIIDDNGEVKFDSNGIIDISEVNKIISQIKGINYNEEGFTVESFNEYNSAITNTKIDKN